LGLYNGTYSTTIVINQGMESITDNGTLDYWLTLIFGPPPVMNTQTGVFVPWTYLLMFGFCFILMTTVGKLNAFLGGMTVGMALIFFGGAIAGIVPLYPEYLVDSASGVPNGPILAVVGAFIAVVSFIGLVGGIER